MKILITDDIALSRQLLIHALKSYGEIEIATNGKEAIATYISAWSDKVPFDVIFLDIMMPEMDGHQTLHLIRQWEEDNNITQTVKVVMSTALGNSENVLASFKEGAEFYLVKPIELKKLYNIMNEMGYSPAEA